MDAQNQIKPRSGLSDEYRAYLKSEHWRALKVQLMTQDVPHCECCGFRRQLDAHHLVYREPLESGTVQDLMLVCRGCHEMIHEHRTYFLTLRELPVEVKRRRIIAYIKGLKRKPLGAQEIGLAWQELRERNSIRAWRGLRVNKY